MLPLKLGIAIGNPELRDEVAATLRDLPASVVSECRDRREWRVFVEHLAGTRPDVVLLDLGSLPGSLDDAVGSVRLASGATVAAVHVNGDSESILKAVRAGVNEYLYPPLCFPLRRLLERKSHELAASRAAPARGQVLAILSAKGGCGATTIACQLAHQLRRLGAPRGHRVLLLDLDLDGGNIAHLTRTPSRHSVLDAFETLYRMEPAQWKSLVTTVAEGLDVLNAPALCAPRHPVTGVQIEKLFEYARSNYEWTAADAGCGWNALGMEALPAADHAFLVFTPDVPALQHTRCLVRDCWTTACPTNASGWCSTRRRGRCASRCGRSKP